MTLAICLGLFVSTSSLAGEGNPPQASTATQSSSSFELRYEVTELEDRQAKQQEILGLVQQRCRQQGFATAQAVVSIKKDGYPRSQCLEKSNISGCKVARITELFQCGKN